MLTRDTDWRQGDLLTQDAAAKLTELNGAGAGGLDRIYYFNRDAEHVEYVIPQDFEQMDPDKQGMAYQTVCHSESGGIIEYYPTAVLWADGI